MENKLIARYVAIGVASLLIIIIFFNSWVDVEPGEHGFVFEPYSSESIKEDNVYDEGTYFILPWNKMFTYETQKELLKMLLEDILTNKYIVLKEKPWKVK